MIELTLDDLKRRNAIGWCHATLGIGLTGCDRVSPACVGCYAEVVSAKLAHMAAMQGKTSPYTGATKDGRWVGGVRVDRDRMRAAFATLPRKVGHDYFVTAMSDVFHKDVPDDFIEEVFGWMVANPHHIFKVLTKRIERVPGFAKAFGEWPANVWIGTTVEDQRRADERIPHLLSVPAVVRFISVEPMFEAIDLTSIAWPTKEEPLHRIDALRGGYWNAEGWYACGPAAQLGQKRGGFTNHSDMPGWPNMIGWVIVGSQSDGAKPGPRETRPEWVRALKDQCVAANVPIFYKQGVVDGRLVTAPEIDGRAWLQMPDGGIGGAR